MSSLDPTFSSYTKSQAQKYARARLSYPSQLYDIIITHHTQTGGRLDTLVDVGCGPGNATRDLALSFEYAFGLDPGAEMISSARQLGGKTRTGGEVRFAVAPAEDCAGVVAEMAAGRARDDKVDLLTAAMAVRNLLLACVFYLFFWVLT
jgi:trans-aconitate methyltransferase